jgi:predicted nucleotidyltransferase
MTITKPILRDVYKGNLSWLVDNTIFLTLHGSHAYGTNLPTSDVDVKGIAIPPSNYYLGLLNNFEQAELKGKEPDGVIYEIRKFFKLARDCNPNIIEVLHTDPEDWIHVHPVGQNILDNRDIFLSKKAYFTFFGYARAQLKRINTHYRWLKNPPTARPVRSEMGLPDRPLIPMDQLTAAMSDIQAFMERWDINWDLLEPSERIQMQERLSLMLGELSMTMDTRWMGAAKLLGYEDNFILYVQKEKEFKQKQSDWESYQDWLMNRNPQRAVLEAQFGYDTKHGMHLVRLIRMCRELLETGKVNVKRHDREELLAIRAGSLPYDKLVEWADSQEKELATLYQTTSALPKHPADKQIDALCEHSIRTFLKL